MTTASTTEIIGAGLFALAILHTFSSGFFERLAGKRPRHAWLLKPLAEVDVVFGIWAVVMIVAMFAIDGAAVTSRYLYTRSFTEPLFVFAMMVIAGTRPILQTATATVRLIARTLPLRGGTSLFVVVMTVVPLLGSFITEPAAMTLAALILADSVFSRGVSIRLKYATLGALLVNVSIGGTLTPYAAPPILMVASTWGWNLGFMATTFGWKAALAVSVNAVGTAWVFRRELAALPPPPRAHGGLSVPPALAAAHLALLAGVVLGAHHPALFGSLFLVFVVLARAYPTHQDRLILGEGLRVACFLGGLVVLGGEQHWWLQPLLGHATVDQAFLGSTGLTAVVDNAALTYLGSRVDGLSDGFKYALVAGAVTGGGLTLIANAPNPAGIAILRGHFDGGAVRPMGLLLAALVPTLIAALALGLL